MGCSSSHAEGDGGRCGKDVGRGATRGGAGVVMVDEDEGGGRGVLPVLSSGGVGKSPGGHDDDDDDAMAVADDSAASDMGVLLLPVEPAPEDGKRRASVVNRGGISEVERGVLDTAPRVLRLALRASRSFSFSACFSALSRSLSSFFMGWKRYPGYVA